MLELYWVLAMHTITLRYVGEVVKFKLNKAQLFVEFPSM